MPGLDAATTGIALTPTSMARSPLLQLLLLSATREEIRGGSYIPITILLPLIPLIILPLYIGS